MVRKKTVSRSDIASMTGVSRQTVSNVVNGKGNYSEEVRKRVMDAVLAMGYSPNPLARGLSTKRTGNVAVLVRGLASPYSGGSAASVCRYLGQASLKSLMMDIEWVDAEFIGSLAQGLADGVILTGGVSREFLATLQDRGLPIVGQWLEGSYDFPVVNPDIGSGVGQLMRHLAGLGHCRIAFIGSTDSMDMRYSSYLEYRDLLDLANGPGLVAPTPHEEQWSPEGGYAAAMSLVDSGVPFTAIFAVSDMVAYGVLKALGRRGLRVPEDVSVVGWDDSGTSSFVQPPLTTVRVDLDLLASRVVGTLMGLMAGESMDTRPMEVSLVIRESTGLPARLP